MASKYIGIQVQNDGNKVPVTAPLNGPQMQSIKSLLEPPRKTSTRRSRRNTFPSSSRILRDGSFSQAARISWIRVHTHVHVHPFRRTPFRQSLSCSHLAARQKREQTNSPSPYFSIPRHEEDILVVCRVVELPPPEYTMQVRPPRAAPPDVR